MIGILEDTAPLEMVGISTSQRDARGRVPGARAARPSTTSRSRPASTPRTRRRELESAFLANGLEAQSIQEVVDEIASAANLTFNRLIQGFMGLGLVVGVAALGVISARAVVERRQQIGVMRAIGFRRRMVQRGVPARVVVRRADGDRRRDGARRCCSRGTSSRTRASSRAGRTSSSSCRGLNLALIFRVVYAVALAGDARAGRPRLARPARRGAPLPVAERRGATLVHMATAPALLGGFELPAGPRLPRVGSVDAVALEERAATLAKRSIKRESKLQALDLAIRMMDLTTLEGQDTTGQGRRALLEGHAAGPRRPRRAARGGGLRLPEPRRGREGAAGRKRREGRVGRHGVPVGAEPDRDQGRRDARGRRARGGRGGHGDRPRRVPLGPVLEGLRRDRPRQGGLRRRAPQGHPRDGRARDLRQRPSRVPARDRGGRRLRSRPRRGRSARPRRCP